MLIYFTKKGKFKTNSYNKIPYNKLYRKVGPAIICSNGDEEWWQHGNLHRLDGPAVKCKDGREEWRINGILHRLNGPALISNNNDKFWYKHGKHHRLDDPAIIWSNGDKEWWINGKKLNTNEVETWIKNNNINLKTKQHQVLFMVRFG